MARELADRRDRLFGREGDLAYLLDRARSTGLTAVVARPQMGKSWLLTELARRLSEESQPPYLVGFAESIGQTPDLLLRAVVDLYGRWLADADYRQQAKMVWKQQKENVLPGVATAVAKMFKEAGQIAKPITGIVEDAINGLIAANQTLTTGGIQLPTLQYDQARDLVSLTNRISGHPIALILDQWEQSPDPKFEAKTLHAFLHHHDEWPPCHVFMALRPDEPAHGEVESLAKGLPGTAKTYPLHEMKLDREEGDRLTAFVRRTVPAAFDQSDDDLLGLVGGFPGVVYRWTSGYQREHMASIADLKQVAADAHAYRFRELDELLPALDAEPRRLAIRLALLPVGSGDFWDFIKPHVLDGLGEDLIDELRIAKVLDLAEPPSYGHAKRAEAARVWLIANRRAATRTEAEGMILRLAASVDAVEPKFAPNLLALWGLGSTCDELALPALPTALCELVGIGFDVSIRSEELISGARQARAAEFAGVAPLLATGLSDALIDAKKEGDLARRDALLEELQSLARAHLENSTAQEQLAKALFNMLHYTIDEDDLERLYVLVAELHALASKHPANTVVRELLANGLFNALHYAKSYGDLARRDSILAELRALAGAHTEDVAVRKNLVMALINTLNFVKQEGDLARRNGLLDEVRGLASAHPGDPTVRENLAGGLFNTLVCVKDEGDLARRDALFEELRGLAGAHAEDAAVREWLAQALFNTLNQAKAEDNLTRRNALLEELRALAGAHPADAAVREWLAKGLYNTLNFAKAEDGHARRDALLDELRALATAHPEDAAVRGSLAMGLGKTMLDAAEEGEPERANELLGELQLLAETHREDGWVERFPSAGLPT